MWHLLGPAYACGSLTTAVCLAIREVADGVKHYRAVKRAIELNASDCPAPAERISFTIAVLATYSWPIFLARPQWFLNPE